MFPYHLAPVRCTQMGTVDDEYVDLGTGEPPVVLKVYVREVFGFKYDRVW